MTRRLFLPGLAVAYILVGCASTVQVKRTDPVTILLENGDKIKAEVIDIHSNRIIFRAQDWKQAYEYGEVINVERVRAIRLGDGERLSVREYDEYRKGGKLKSREVARRRGSDRTSPIDNSLQFDEIKDKPISEMTDNEFAFFMMMKGREIEAERAAAASKTPSEPAPSKERPVEVIVIGPPNQEPVVSSSSPDGSPEKVAVSFEPKPEPAKPEGPPVIDLKPSPASTVSAEEVARTLFEADVAVMMLNHLKGKRNLTVAEASLLELIETNPEWQNKLDDLVYLNRTAEKAFERAYLYNPDDLEAKLGLQFDKDLDMDYPDLMAQLHRRLGEDVKMSDFRTLLDVFGESGSRAVKEILENYNTWQFAMDQKNRFVTK